MGKGADERSTGVHYLVKLRVGPRRLVFRGQVPAIFENVLEDLHRIVLQVVVAEVQEGRFHRRLRVLQQFAYTHLPGEGVRVRV